MKRTDMGDVVHDHATDSLTSVLNSVPTIIFKSKLDEALEKRGLSQRKLATLCGLRPNTVTDLVNGNRLAISKSHIAAVMIALRITDIREIIDIEFSFETVEQFNKEGANWVENDVIPEEISRMYAENAKKSVKTDIRG